MSDIQRIGVIGAGTMGNGIAQVFTQSGFDVRLVDAAAPALERARTTIAKSLEKFVEKGKLTPADRDAALGRLSSGTDVDALADADYIVEAIVEDAGAKRDLFARLDTLARPDIDALRRRVTVKAYESELPPPNDRPARAEVRLRDGRVLSAECLSARGGADRPLPPTTVDDKLAQLAVPAYPKIADVLAPIRALEADALRRGWRQTVDAFIQ